MRCCGRDIRHAASAASAIEHFHTAALIHDDIADEATTRRGVPCMHLTEGLGIAINTGDLALSMVNGAVMRDPYLTDAQKVRVVTELIEMTRRTMRARPSIWAGRATSVTTSLPTIICAWQSIKPRIILVRFRCCRRHRWWRHRRTDCRAARIWFGYGFGFPNSRRPAQYRGRPRNRG